MITPHAPRPRGTVAVLPRRHTVPRAEAQDDHPRAGAAAIKGTGLIFAGYVLLMIVEWIGLSNDIALLRATRFSTLLAYLLLMLLVARVGAPTILAQRQSKILAGFIVLTCLSVMWADVTMNVVNSIRPLVDYFVFMIVTAYILDRSSRVDRLAIVLGIVGMVLVARNNGKLGSSERVGAFAAPYFLGDGNDFAWGMNVMAPLVLILVLGQRRLITRLFGLAGVTACLLGNIGTQSRGGSIGLAAAVLFGWLFVSRRKGLGALAIALLLAALFLVAPPSYFDRMRSVTSYEEDNSAQARLEAWGAAIHMALDHPLGVGAGNFNSAYGRSYRPEPGTGRITWASGRWISPHSIYFKVLGEYGFPGLFMLLLLIGTNLRDNFVSARLIRSAPPGAGWNEYWPGLVSMSIIGFAVSGIFLGGFNYPHLFFLTAVTLGLKRVLALESTRRVAAAAPSTSLSRSSPRAASESSARRAGMTVSLPRHP